MTTDTDELLQQAATGDAQARGDLLSRHRERLRKMVAVYLDQRIRSRVDPSDVVQDALAEADQRLTDYLKKRPVAFYPWLRQIAWERIDKEHRRHLKAQRRSVTREESLLAALSGQSVYDLADRLIASGATPSQHMQREDLRRRARAALEDLSESDREVLILRYLEQLSMREIAAITGATESAIKMRHLRALERVRRLLGELSE